MAYGDIIARRLAASLHLRVALAGSGAFRARQDADGNLTVLCVLPGAGHVVSVRHAGDHLAQISYPDARPLSSELPLTEPQWIGPIMNAVDFYICRDDFQPGPPDHPRFLPADQGGVPTEVFDLADVAIRSIDWSIRNAARSLPADTVDLAADRSGAWHLPVEALPFVMACQKSSDPEVAAAAELLSGISEHRVASRPFVPFISQLRWLDNEPAPAQSVAAKGATWLQLTNPAALASESLRLGLRCRDLLTMDSAGNPLPLGQRECWSLRDAQGCRALAMIEDGNVQVFDPGVEAGARGLLQAVDILRQARGVSHGYGFR